MEMWIDQNNSNVWKKVHEYIVVATFRWDGSANVDFRNLSVERDSASAPEITIISLLFLN